VVNESAVRVRVLPMNVSCSGGGGGSGTVQLSGLAPIHLITCLSSRREQSTNE
jgi:hypothetical protein